jgi:UDP-N-acetylmuramate dehydrogenase
MAAVLEHARVFRLTTGISSNVSGPDLLLAYRSSSIGPFDVVESASFALVEGDATSARQQIDEIVRWRRENQPGGPNAGSVFTNPTGSSAGALVEQAGLKGYRAGTARVSSKHANFIQADLGGSAADIRALVDHVHSEVLTRTGTDLRTELKMVGFAEDPVAVFEPAAGGRRG